MTASQVLSKAKEQYFCFVKYLPLLRSQPFVSLLPGLLLLEGVMLHHFQSRPGSVPIGYSGNPESLEEGFGLGLGDFSLPIPPWSFPSASPG